MSRAPMPGQDRLAEPLRSRASISVFDPSHELTRGQVETLLQAARWATSGGNSQPWRFVVALRGDAAHEVLLRSLTRGNAGWVPAASAVVIGLAKVGPEPGEERAPHRDYAFYGLGAAMAHLSVQAHLMGLSDHQFAGFDHALVAAELQVPEWAAVTAAIALGMPGDHAEADPSAVEKESRPRERRGLDEIAFTDRFGNPF